MEEPATVTPQKPSAVITLEIVAVTETEDEYIVNASSEGLIGGEPALLSVLKGFIETLEARAELAPE